MIPNFVDQEATGDLTGQVKIKNIDIRDMLTLGWLGALGPLEKLEWTQFRPNFSRMYTEGTMRAPNLGTCALEVAQKATTIFKPHICRSCFYPR